VEDEADREDVNVSFSTITQPPATPAAAPAPPATPPPAENT